MSGATLKDLTKYHQGAMQYFKNGLVSKQNRLYAQTAEAGAVSFWPLGGTPLEGKVKFSFKETPPASGDKGPENPSTITGVSSVNVGRIGKNLLLQASGSPSRYTVVRNADGSLSISGSGSAIFQVTDSGAGTTGPYSSCRLNLNKQYTLSVEVVSGSLTDGTINIAQSAATQRSVSIPASGKSSITFTPSDAGYVNGRFVCRMLTGSSSVATNAVLKIQLEEGDTATDFEAPMLPADANHILPLGSTYYGGSVDLATGVMTVTHAAVTPDASTVDISSAPAALPLDYADTYGRTVTSVDGTSLSVGSAGGTVVYKLSTPYTVQLTPLQLTALAQKDKYTPRMNTVYTDADSIQIRYRKSLIHDEDEKVQAIVALGGNV